MPRHTATVCFPSSLGLVEVESAASAVTRVRLAARGKPREVGDGAALAYARQAREEILAYLAGSLSRFTVAVALEGTPFQHAVWERSQRIPYGSTCTYGEVAAELGKPRAARAVGTACCANPVPIFIPCHRIVSGDGARGPAEGVAAMKYQLLDLEHAKRALPLVT